MKKREKHNFTIKTKPQPDQHLDLIDFEKLGTSVIECQKDFVANLLKKHINMRKERNSN